MKPKSIEQHEKHKRGVCPRCGLRNDRFPKWYCSECLRVHNEWARNYTQMRKLNGVCPRCGDNMDKGSTQCPPCVVKHNVELKKYRDKKKVKTTVI